jgi:hypothetical protein
LPNQWARRKVMEKNYYNAASLERVLLFFERRYGLSSDEFFEKHLADEPPVERVPGFHRHAWASFYRDFRRLSGRSFAEHAEGVLAV